MRRIARMGTNPAQSGRPFDKTLNEIGIALHVELAVIFMCDSEAEALVESPRRIHSHDTQAHSKIQRSGFANQAVYHLSADTLALKPAVHEQLCDEKFIIFADSLQPANIAAVEHDDANLGRVPLLPEAGFLRGPVQI